jgi:hypothetical protein
VFLAWLVDELFAGVSAVVCLQRNASDVVGGVMWKRGRGEDHEKGKGFMQVLARR